MQIEDLHIPDLKTKQINCRDSCLVSTQRGVENAQSSKNSGLLITLRLTNTAIPVLACYLSKRVQYVTSYCLEISRWLTCSNQMMQSILIIQVPNHRPLQSSIIKGKKHLHLEPTILVPATYNFKIKGVCCFVACMSNFKRLFVKITYKCDAVNHKLHIYFSRGL